MYVKLFFFPLSHKLFPHDIFREDNSDSLRHRAASTGIAAQIAQMHSPKARPRSKHLSRSEFARQLALESQQEAERQEALNLVRKRRQVNRTTNHAESGLYNDDRIHAHNSPDRNYDAYLRQSMYYDQDDVDDYEWY